MLHRLFLVSSLASLALLTQVPSALACSPPLPGLYGSIPQEWRDLPGQRRALLQRLRHLGRQGERHG